MEPTTEPGRFMTLLDVSWDHCELLVIGFHADGGEIRARVTGDMNPGTGSTSKIIAEAALCLIQDCPDTPGGMWTPTATLGATLIRRLVDHAGMTFDLVDVDA